MFLKNFPNENSPFLITLSVLVCQIFPSKTEQKEVKPLIEQLRSTCGVYGFVKSISDINSVVKYKYSLKRESSVFHGQREKRV